MERRCVLCTEVLSEEDISGAIDYAMWDEFGGNVSLTEEEACNETGPQPPEGANCQVTWSDRCGGWVHFWCESAYGTGRTAHEEVMQFWEGIHRPPPEE
jgi:hypothetical protein